MPMSAGVAELYGASAGLDAVSGVLGYLSSLNAASAASSRADMIRMAADADAQRYNEKARAHIAQQKAEFLGSGVTLAGSPIDVLDTSARLAAEDVASIRMHGAASALDEEQRGQNALVGGRDQLVGGFRTGIGAVTQGYMLATRGEG